MRAAASPEGTAPGRFDFMHSREARRREALHPGTVYVFYSSAILPYACVHRLPPRKRNAHSYSPRVRGEAPPDISAAVVAKFAKPVETRAREALRLLAARAAWVRMLKGSLHSAPEYHQRPRVGPSSICTMSIRLQSDSTYDSPDSETPRGRCRAKSKPTSNLAEVARRRAK